MNEVLFDSIRHNNWATARLVEFCREQDLSEEQIRARGVGTYGDIRETLNHIIACDGSYVRRMLGIPLEWASSEVDVELAQLAERAAELSRLWEQVLANPIDVERVLVIDDGAEEVRLGIFVAQALNHANHHREQVCAILTGLGIEPPDIQAWEYAWVTGRIWKRTADG
jgi:uncharacterized damage-inducible protein DinB